MPVDAPWTISGPTDIHIPACEQILRALPAWFGIESAIVDYVAALENLPTLVAIDPHQTVLGFLAIKLHFKTCGEVHVMAVHPAHHRRGIGRALVHRAEAWLRQRGCALMQVKTVGPLSADTFYAQTRCFYRALGFLPLEEFPTLWDERNPCLVMVKPLQ